MSKALNSTLHSALHGALAILLRHMGVPEDLIRLLHTLNRGSRGRIATAQRANMSTRFHRALRHASSESVVLYLLLLGPTMCCVLNRVKGNTRQSVPPLVLV